MEYQYDKPSDNRLISKDRQAILLNQPDNGSIIHTNQLMKYLRGHFRLDWNGVHGAGHWARVLKNGLGIAAREGARADVVTLFAFLHDHEREHDNEDFIHGERAALNAINLRGTYFEIDDAGFALLQEAMSGHSHGGTIADITIQACWDADRLDLGRVGITPDPKYLCTATAKDPDFLREAFQRSIS